MTEQVVDIGLIDVVYNPRKQFDEKGQNEMAESIKLHGQQDAVTVIPLENGRFRLVKGERRYRALKALGRSEIKITDTQERDAAKILTLQLIENIQREDMNPVDEAEACKKYIDEYKWTTKRIANELSKDVDWVERRLTLLQAGPEVVEAVRSDKIKLGHGLALIEVSDPKKKLELLDKAVKEGMSVSELQYRVKEGSIELANAMFKKDECESCKDNGGKQATLDGVKGKCFNAPCFIKKQVAAINAIKAGLKGINVIAVDDRSELKVQDYDVLQPSEIQAARQDMMANGAKYALEMKIVGGVCHQTFFKLKDKTAPAKTADSSKKDDKAPTDPASKEGKAEKKEMTKEEADKKLLVRIKEYKAPILLGICRSKSDKWDTEYLHAREVLSVFNIIKSSGATRASEVKTKIAENSSNKSLFKVLMELPANKLFALREEELKFKMSELTVDELELLAKDINVDMTKDYSIDAKYLDLYTMPQLKELPGKLDTGPLTSKKKDEMVKEMLSRTSIAGKIPPGMEI
jgi:ParB/RepB/Spo0J family partition protein